MSSLISILAFLVYKKRHWCSGTTSPGAEGKQYSSDSVKTVNAEI